MEDFSTPPLMVVPRVNGGGVRLGELGLRLANITHTLVVEGLANHSLGKPYNAAVFRLTRRNVRELLTGDHEVDVCDAPTGGLMGDQSGVQGTFLFTPPWVPHTAVQVATQGEVRLCVVDGGTPIVWCHSSAALVAQVLALYVFIVSRDRRQTLPRARIAVIRAAREWVLGQRTPGMVHDARRLQQYFMFSAWWDMLEAHVRFEVAQTALHRALCGFGVVTQQAALRARSAALAFQRHCVSFYTLFVVPKLQAPRDAALVFYAGSCVACITHALLINHAMGDPGSPIAADLDFMRSQLAVWSPFAATSHTLAATSEWVHPNYLAGIMQKAGAAVLSLMTGMTTTTAALRTTIAHMEAAPDVWGRVQPPAPAPPVGVGPMALTPRERPPTPPLSPGRCAVSAGWFGGDAAVTCPNCRYTLRLPPPPRPSFTRPPAEAVPQGRIRRLPSPRFFATPDFVPRTPDARIPPLRAPPAATE